MAARRTSAGASVAARPEIRASRRDGRNRRRASRPAAGSGSRQVLRRRAPTARRTRPGSRSRVFRRRRRGPAGPWRGGSSRLACRARSTGSARSSVTGSRTRKVSRLAGIGSPPGTRSGCGSRGERRLPQAGPQRAVSAGAGRPPPGRGAPARPAPTRPASGTPAWSASAHSPPTIPTTHPTSAPPTTSTSSARCCGRSPAPERPRRRVTGVRIARRRPSEPGFQLQPDPVLGLGPGVVGGFFPGRLDAELERGRPARDQPEPPAEAVVAPGVRQRDRAPASP